MISTLAKRHDQVHFRLSWNFPEVTFYSSLSPCLWLATSKAAPSQITVNRGKHHTHLSFTKYFHSTGNPALMSHGAKEVYTLVQPLFMVTVLIVQRHSELQLQLLRAIPGYFILSSNSYTFSRGTFSQFHRPARVPTDWTATSAILTSYLMHIRHWAMCFINRKIINSFWGFTEANNYAEWPTR